MAILSLCAADMFGVLSEMEALKATRVFGILGAYLAVLVTAVVFTVVSSIGSDSAAPGAAP